MLMIPASVTVHSAGYGRVSPKSWICSSVNCDGLSGEKWMSRYHWQALSLWNSGCRIKDFE